MIKENDLVVSVKSLQGGEIPVGTIGTVIDVYTNPMGFEVEFCINDEYIPVGCHSDEIILAKDRLQKAG
jgi:hypothetical protein